MAAILVSQSPSLTVSQTWAAGLGDCETGRL
jgi:hypothetical protein